MLCHVVLLSLAACVAPAECIAPPPPPAWKHGMDFLFANSELGTLSSYSNAFEYQSESSLMFNTFSAADGVLLFTSKDDVKVENVRRNPKVRAGGPVRGPAQPLHR